MSNAAHEIIPVNLEDEMRQSYLDYAMSVIVGRALPDVRDGLKPVHRRVLYAMRELGNDWNKPYKKSARVVGDVIGKYHPHGDVAVYDTVVRMAQPFSMRYLLIDGQGNFGSIDGDSPAAMRYTEVRMTRLAHELLADLDKETVDFTPNYDESEAEPAVLPTRVPNLLVNGSSGIAVGMATNIPPHNLREVVDACLALIDTPEIDIEGLMQHLPAPDFPTAGFINGTAGVREAYRTGRGRVHIRARAEVVEDGGRDVIVVHELPYQVNKARLLERIAEMVKEKRLEGITELRDESDKDGLRVVIELRRGESGEVMLNNLYQQTQLEVVFGINMVGLLDGRPQLLNLRQLLDAFVRHRREVVTRRTLYELRRARDRAHVLEGLAVALANIDEMIELIKASANPAEAREAMMARDWPPGIAATMLARAGAQARPDWLEPGLGLQASAGYRLSREQAQAILDLRLHRLTGLEQRKILDEFNALLERIAELSAILAEPARLMAVIRQELVEIRDGYGDARRSEIIEQRQDLDIEDLIAPEDMVVTLSHHGYVKTQPLDQYQAQRRGGRGKSATSHKETDFVDKLFVANTHDTLLCFSSLGRVYWIKVYQLPQGSRTSRGRPIVNLLPLEEHERINAVLAIRDYPEDVFVFMSTARGVVKKTPLSEYSRPRSSGIIAVNLAPEDRLVDVALTTGDSEILLVSSAGKGIRFGERDVRPMGRVAAGVRGMRLAESAEVIALLVFEPGSEDNVLTVTARGYGKRSRLEDFPLRGRGGQGVIAMQTPKRNGTLVGAIRVSPEDEVMLVSEAGVVIRTATAEIPVLGRSTQGVRVIRLEEAGRLCAVERLAQLDDEPAEEIGEEEPEAGESQAQVPDDDGSDAGG